MGRWWAAIAIRGFIATGKVLKYFTERISIHPNCIRLDSFTQV
jgi:hypothetical protein